jgi:hypothetical protein
MRKLIIPSLLLLGGCATVPGFGPPPAMPPQRQALISLELEYVNQFLVPATSYTLLPRCPQPPGMACSDPAVVAQLRTAQGRIHNAIYAARDLIAAAPQADATMLLANARASLHAGEAILPKQGH